MDCVKLRPIQSKIPFEGGKSVAQLLDTVFGSDTIHNIGACELTCLTLPVFSRDGPTTSIVLLCDLATASHQDTLRMATAAH